MVLLWLNRQTQFSSNEFRLTVRGFESDKAHLKITFHDDTGDWTTVRSSLVLEVIHQKILGRVSLQPCYLDCALWRWGRFASTSFWCCCIQSWWWYWLFSTLSPFVTHLVILKELQFCKIKQVFGSLRVILGIFLVYFVNLKKSSEGLQLYILRDSDIEKANRVNI